MSLESALRQIIAEEVAAAFAKHFGDKPAEPAPTPTKVNTSGWEETHGVKVHHGTTNPLKLKWSYRGEPVKVAGLGRRTEKNPNGAIQSGWWIEKIERRPKPDAFGVGADVYDYNVTVMRSVRGRPETKVVKADRLYYVQPKEPNRAPTQRKEQ